MVVSPTLTKFPDIVIDKDIDKSRHLGKSFKAHADNTFPVYKFYFSHRQHINVILFNFFGKDCGFDTPGKLSTPIQPFSAFKLLSLSSSPFGVSDMH